MKFYKAMVFFSSGWEKNTGTTKEEALSGLEGLLKVRPEFIGKPFKLTYQPSSGMIHLNYNHIPCGVVFERGDQ